MRERERERAPQSLLGTAQWSLTIALLSQIAEQPRCQEDLPCTHGVIEAAFNHLDRQIPLPNFPDLRFMHMALIPKGGANLSPPWQGTLRRGSVLVFDEGRREPNGCDAAPETPWAIFDPEAPATSPRWLDFYPIANRLPHPRYPPTPQYPNGKSTGNLACSHHTWTHDGRLALFGGNEKHSHQTGCIDGGYHVYLFDPTQGPIGNLSWVRQNTSLLPTKRWYPSVVLTVVDTIQGLRPRILVLGGNIDPLSTPSNYIAWVPPLAASTQQGSWEGGGTGVEIPGPSGQPLLTYPYAHLMSNGCVAVVRFREAQVAMLLHNVNNTGTWTPLTDGVQARLRVREWGNSLLFPNLDADHRNAIVVLGGALARTIHHLVEVREEERRTRGCRDQPGPKRPLSNE